MPRPRCCRRITGSPAFKTFKPAGLAAKDLEELTLTLEEYEAIRLADFESLYQEEAATRMGVSRQTFGRTIERARSTVARALVLGCALRIETSDAAWPPERLSSCPFCGGRTRHCSRCGGKAYAHCHATKIPQP